MTRPPMPHPDDIAGDDPDCPICDGAGRICPITPELQTCPLCWLYQTTSITQHGLELVKRAHHINRNHLVECSLCLGAGRIHPQPPAHNS